MTSTKSNVGLGLGVGSLLFVFACGGSGNNTFGNGDPNSTGASMGSTTTGNLGLTGGTGMGAGGGTGTSVPGGVPGQTIDPNSACVSDAREGEQVPVDLYFMVDKTGSMTCPTGRAGDQCSSPPRNPVNGPTRWSEMSKALNAFVSAPENAGIGAGIGFFPRPGNDTTNDPRITCQEPDYEKPDVEIGVLPAVAAAISTSIMNQMPGGSTPTVPSITAALKYAAMHQASAAGRRTALVYATDGIPQGCTNNTVAGAAAAAKAALMTSMINTYVLGVGPQLNSLNEIATAGGTNMAYLVDTGGDVTAQLAAALHAIKSMAITCDYKIPMSSAGPIDPNQVNVIAKVGDMGMSTLIGQVNDKAGCDKAGGGWYYDTPGNPSLISLCPTTCNPLLATPNSHLQVLIGCATQGQPVK
jgi:hypothetical protein